MYQTVFDIREPSVLSLILYIFWTTVHATITILFIIISYKLRQQGRFNWRWFIWFLIVVVISDFILASFFFRRSRFINTLNTDKAQVISGTVLKVRKSKSEYVTVNNYEFVISGPAEITPAFTKKGILKEGQNVKIHFQDGDILRLEIKQ